MGPGCEKPAIIFFLQEENIGGFFEMLRTAFVRMCCGNLRIPYPAAFTVARG